MSSTALYRAIVCGLCSLMSVYASAENCFAPSPNFQADQQKYYDLATPIAVPLAEQQEFSQQMLQLGRRLTGHGERAECPGSEKNPRLNYFSSKIKAQLQSSVGNGSHLQLTLIDEKSKTEKTEQLQFFGNTPAFNFQKLSPGHYHFAQKMRHRKLATPNTQSLELPAGLGNLKDKTTRAAPQPITGSGLEEMIVDLQFIGGGLTIEIEHFINGFYYATDRYELSTNH